MQKSREMSLRLDNAAAFTSSSSRRSRWQVSRSSWQGTALDTNAARLLSGPDGALDGVAAQPPEASGGQQADGTTGCPPRSSSWNRNSSRHTKFSARNWLVELLSLGSEDAEETLLCLGFGNDDPGSVARVPERFLQGPSRVQGISCDLLRLALVQRREQDELRLLGRFRNAQKLPVRFLSTSSEGWKTGDGNPASEEFNLEPMPGLIQSRTSPSPIEDSGDNSTNKTRSGTHSDRAWLIQQLRRSISWQNTVENPTVPSDNANESWFDMTDVWDDAESPEESPTEQGVVQNTGRDEHLFGATGEQNVYGTVFNSYMERGDFLKNVDAQQLPGSTGFVYNGRVLRSVGIPFHEKSREYSSDSTEDFGEPAYEEDARSADESAAPLAPRQTQTPLAPPSAADRRHETGDGGCWADGRGLEDATRGADEQNSAGASWPGGRLPQSPEPDDERQKDSFEMDEVRSEDGACVDRSSSAEDLVRTSSMQSDSSGYSEEPTGAQTPALPPAPPSREAPCCPES